MAVWLTWNILRNLPIWHHCHPSILTKSPTQTEKIAGSRTDAMMARRNFPTPYHCSGRRRTRENRIFSPRTVVCFHHVAIPFHLFCFAYRVTKRKGQFLPDNTDTLSSTQPGLSNIYYIVVLWTVVYLSADRLTPFGRSYPFQVPTQLICNDRERVEGGSTKPRCRRHRPHGETRASCCNYT